MLLCSPWLIVFGPLPPQCKSLSLTMLYGRDMFLVSDSCSMLNHVKPQLCALVLVCQEAYSTVGACLTSHFHALSASKLANSCVFHQKWFLEMCFFPCLPEGGRGEWQDQGDWKAGLQIKVRCASHSAVRWMHTFISNKVLNHADSRIYRWWRQLEGHYGLWGKTNQSVFLTNELWDESLKLALKERLFSEKCVFFWLQVQS